MGRSVTWRAAAGCCLVLLPAAFFTTRVVVAQYEAPLDAYFATPDTIPENTPAPIAIQGVFPVGAVITEVEATAEA